MTTAVSDSFAASTNETLERVYQLVNAGTPQPLAGWGLHAQFRYANGDLALDCTLSNGLLVVTDFANGIYKLFVQPSDLAALVPGPLAFDILAIPPDKSRVYRVVYGAPTFAAGATRISRT